MKVTSTASVSMLCLSIVSHINPHENPIYDVPKTPLDIFGFGTYVPRSVDGSERFQEMLLLCSAFDKAIAADVGWLITQ